MIFIFSFFKCLTFQNLKSVNKRLVSFDIVCSGLELCEPSLRLMATTLAGLTTVAGELLLLAVALGCQSWRGLLGAGSAPLTLFLSYG